MIRQKYGLADLIFAFENNIPTIQSLNNFIGDFTDQPVVAKVIVKPKVKLGNRIVTEHGLLSNILDKLTLVD